LGGRPGGDPLAAGARGTALERLILDTTILVSAERGAKRLEKAIADDDDVAIAAVTAAELLVGVELAAPRRRAKRAAFVEDVLETLTVEEYTLATARAHAYLLAATRAAGTPRGAHDLIIAATAIASGRIVITGDARGFGDLPGVDVRAI
jgi:tRNA(fMet)-specific endonuclease VapC